MTPEFAARILRLPASILGELSVVPGPGWEITRGAILGGAYGPTAFRAVARCGADVSDRYAWWPANPAASVAVVLGCPITSAHLRLADLDFALPDDDHEAAICIIEAHVARSIE